MSRSKKTYDQLVNNLGNYQLKFDKLGNLLTDVVGTKGEQGFRGLQGDQGVKGEKGATGQIGISGQKGADGLKGSIGETGEKGSRGERGFRGFSGSTGAKGDNGEKGDIGEKGAPSAIFAFQGQVATTDELALITQKQIGYVWQVELDDSLWAWDGSDFIRLAEALEAIKGEKGETGQTIKGEKGLPGELGGNGSNGEKGETGSKGEPGINGSKGENGSNGTNGIKGEPGSNGTKGEQGDIGLKGDTGPRGAFGEQGEKGESGSKGQTGDKGNIGDKGDNGLEGSKGNEGPKGEVGEKGTKGEVSPNIMPTGIIMPFMGTVAPDGWLLCDGSAIPSGNPNLVSMVGNNTPNLKGRFLAGAGENGLALGNSYNDSTRKPRNNSFEQTVDTRHNHKFDINANGISTGSGGSHSHTINSNLYVNQDNKSSNGGNKVNYNRTNYNGGSSTSLNTTTGGSHSHTFDVKISNVSTNNAGSTSAQVSSSGWDNYTRPHTYAVNYIIKHD